MCPSAKDYASREQHGWQSALAWAGKQPKRVGAARLIVVSANR
jgi:hypothetical protein